MVDNYSRESLALQAGFRLTGDDVVDVLNAVIRKRGVPTSIRCGPQARHDNGTEFTSRVLDQWAHWNGVALNLSRPGNRLTTA